MGKYLLLLVIFLAALFGKNKESEIDLDNRDLFECIVQEMEQNPDEWEVCNNEKEPSISFYNQNKSMEIKYFKNKDIILMGYLGHYQNLDSEMKNIIKQKINVKGK